MSNAKPILSLTDFDAPYCPFQAQPALDPQSRSIQAQARIEAAWLNGGLARSTPAMLRRDAERHKRIATAAYFKAEARGFAPGGALDDWLQAEQEVDAALGLGR